VVLAAPSARPTQLVFAAKRLRTNGGEEQCAGRRKNEEICQHHLYNATSAPFGSISVNQAMSADVVSFNNRPRQILGYLEPSEKFAELESVWP
jgi:hypothetical protein